MTDRQTDIRDQEIPVDMTRQRGASDTATSMNINDRFPSLSQRNMH